MAVIKEMFTGIAQRIRLENSMQLQKAQLVRPVQVKLEVATILNGIDQELKDPELKARFDNVIITIPV